MKKYILRYGVIGGCVSIALGLINWFTIARSFGPGVSQTVGYLSITVSLLTIPLGILYFRDKLNSGVVSFKQGFQIGFGITLIASVIIYFYGAIFFILEGDRFEEWNKRGLSVDELQAMQQRMDQMPEYAASPWFQGLILALSVILIGLIINLISSLVLKKAP